MGSDGQLRLVELADVSPDDVLVHDAHRADPSLAFALARLNTDDFSPTPFGVFRDVQRPEYSSAVAEQVMAASEQEGSRRSRRRCSVRTGPGRSADRPGSSNRSGSAERDQPDVIRTSPARAPSPRESFRTGVVDVGRYVVVSSSSLPHAEAPITKTDAATAAANLLPHPLRCCCSHCLSFRRGPQPDSTQRSPSRTRGSTVTDHPGSSDAFDPQDPALLVDDLVPNVVRNDDLQHGGESAGGRRGAQCGGRGDHLTGVAHGMVDRIERRSASARPRRTRRGRDDRVVVAGPW